MFKRSTLSQAIVTALLVASLPGIAFAETANEKQQAKKKADSNDAQVLPEVSVSEKVEQSFVEKYKIPNTVETISKEEINERVNLMLPMQLNTSRVSLSEKDM